MLMSEWKLNKMALRNKRALQTKQWRVTFNQSISSLQRVCKFNHHHSTSHTHTNRPQQTTVCSLNHPLSRYADIHITDFNLAAARSSQWATDTLPPERTPVRIRERTLVGSPGGTQRRTRGKTRRRNRRGGITKRTPRVRLLDMKPPIAPIAIAIIAIPTPMLIPTLTPAPTTPTATPSTWATHMTTHRSTLTSGWTLSSSCSRTTPSCPRSTPCGRGWARTQGTRPSRSGTEARPSLRRRGMNSSACCTPRPPKTPRT